MLSGRPADHHAPPGIMDDTQLTVVWGRWWCFWGFLNTLSSISMSVLHEEMRTYPIQKILLNLT